MLRLVVVDEDDSPLSQFLAGSSQNREAAERLAVSPDPKNIVKMNPRPINDSVVERLVESRIAQRAALLRAGVEAKSQLFDELASRSCDQLDCVATHVERLYVRC